MRIQDLAQNFDIARQALPNVGGKEKGDDFAQTLMDVMKEVSALQQDSRSAQEAVITGQNVEFHDVMIAMERASLAMNLTLAVRNKVLEAYQEIARMQV